MFTTTYNNNKKRTFNALVRYQFFDDILIERLLKMCIDNNFSRYRYVYTVSGDRLYYYTDDVLMDNGRLKFKIVKDISLKYSGRRYFLDSDIFEYLLTSDDVTFLYPWLCRDLILEIYRFI